MTGVQLKELCKEQGLKVSGKKADLKDRLREHFLTATSAQGDEDEFESMSDDDLTQSLVVRNLETSGSREDRLERIRADIQFLRELENVGPQDDANGYRTILEALEVAAQNGGATGEILADVKAKKAVKSKFVDVTIQSLGMKPEKETTGGAPSVTADVVRALAGDPFEDPPKYGSVSFMLLHPAAAPVEIHSHSLSFLRRTNSSVEAKKDTKPALHYLICAPLVRLIR